MKTQTDQLNLRPSVDLIKRLEKLAEKFRNDPKKKNEIAVDILENYMSHWEQAEQFRHDVMKSQLDNQPKLAPARMAQVEELKSESERKKKKKVG